MRSLFTTFLTGILAITSTYCIPVVDIAVRGAYTPTIISPAADTVWSLGKPAAVTWDATKVPKGSDPIGSLELFSAGSSTSLAQLASNFDPVPGSVGFVVPQVSPGSYIVKIGDQASAQFQIVAQATSYLPDISSPSKGTAWKVGQKVTVTWDKSSVPSNAAPLAYLDLYTDGYGGGSLFVARLASQIDVYSGSITITVPQVRAGDSYLVMLGGYGHSSAHFTINA